MADKKKVFFNEEDEFEDRVLLLLESNIMDAKIKLHPERQENLDNAYRPIHPDNDIFIYIGDLNYNQPDKAQVPFDALIVVNHFSKHMRGEKGYRTKCAEVRKLLTNAYRAVPQSRQQIGFTKTGHYIVQQIFAVSSIYTYGS